MKRILLLIISLVSLFIHTLADEKHAKKTSEEKILLEIHQYNNDIPIHRAPVLINIEAYYNSISNTINIEYEDMCEGKVYLYHEDILEDFSPSINSSFQLLYLSGTYRLEIHCDGWSAVGFINL